MKRGFGFGKIGLNLGQMKLNESAEKKEEPSSQAADEGGGGGGGFGTFSSKGKPAENTITNLVHEVETVAESEFIEEVNPDLAAVMGFSGFSSSSKAPGNKLTPKSVNKTAPTVGKKAAQQFDVETMFAAAAKTAQEKNFHNNQKLEEEGRADLEEGVVIPQVKPAAGKVKTPREKTKEDSEGSNSESDSEDDDDDETIGPLPPPPSQTKNSSLEAGEEEEEEEREETPVEKIPHSHNVELEHGEKAITSLAIDPSGSRVITGSADYELKFWDFAGMDPSLRSFRKKKPCESHVLNHLEYSRTGDKILVCAGNSQPKVLDRDGTDVLECVKGDQYVLDQTRNKGHTAQINSGNWHPKIKEEFLTCSQDCTLRLWLTTDYGKKSKVIKCKNRRSGLKAIPTNCTYSRDGLLVCAVCNDGSIQMWDHRKSFVNVCLQMENAHTFGNEITGVQFAYDNRMLATKSNDETLKLWDMRSFKKPVNVAEGLFSRFDQTDVLFSPDDKLVVTPTSKEKNEAGGKLVFFDRDTFKRSFEITVGESHCIRAEWHPKINQILVGSGNGVVNVYYDPNRSIRGAKMCVVKKRTEAKTVNYITNQRIIVPYALPMFRQESSRQKSTWRQYEKARKDPLQSKNPEKPQHQKGTGGRVAKGGSTLASYMAKQIAVKNKDDHIDPRAAILRHAGESEENPYWITPAYVKTQPKPIFQEVDPDEPPKKLTKSETFG